MASKKVTARDFNTPSQLRAAAETRLAQSPTSEEYACPETELLHELQVHQIELEMQNEALIATRNSLEEFRDRFVDFYELAPVGFLTIANNGFIADINLTGAALLGAERNRILQRQFSSFLIPGDADCWHLHLNDGLKTDDKRTCELGLVRQNGAHAQVRLDSLRVIKDGQAPMLRIVLTDITDSKQAENALRKERELYAGLINAHPSGIYRVRIFNQQTWDKQAWLNSTRAPYSMDLVTKRFCDILGVEKAAFESNPGILIDLIHPDDKTEFAQIHDDAMANPKSFYWEGRLLVNGETRWVSFESLPLPLENGDVLWTGSLLDITERKNIESALRESEHRLRSFFDNIPVGIFISTREGKFVYLNPAMPIIMGYDSCDEMMDVVNRRSIAEVLYVDPPQRQTLIAELDQNLTNWLSYENRYRCKDGKIITANIAISERVDEISKQHRFYGIVTDITKRKQVEADLLAAKTAAESANVTKSRFLAAASHDLRQPMHAIRLFVDSLSRTDLSDAQKKISHHLEETTQSLTDLLDALLNISRLDAGVVKPDPEIIQVDSLFNKIATEFSSLATEKSLRFNFSFPFGDIAVITDAKLLMSLLGNLIGNAIKYTDRGGVLVAIRRRGSQALIQVWDTGTGIAPEHLDCIFEEYFQIGNPERDRTKGLGLGLAIAKRIANLLETEVVCRSRPGKGSVFEFRLPLASSEESEPSSRSNLPAAADEIKPASRHIVLLEDNVMVGTATTLALKSCGMTVSLYKTAEDALADSNIANADFYISDLRLPGLNGLEFLDAVQQRTTKPIKALIVTGDTAMNQHGLLRSTPWPVLFKPIDLSNLLAAIKAQDSV